MEHRVALRFLFARKQLQMGVDLIEKLVGQEKWDEARDAVRDLGKTLGVFFTGGDGISVHSGWWSGMDNEDKHRFHSWIQVLHNIYGVVESRAVKGRAPIPFEPMWLDAMFRHVREDLPWLQDTMRDESDEFKHGHFTIIPLKGVTDTSEAIKTLDETAGHIHSKFSQVLYGKVYIRKDLLPAGSFDPRPGQGGMIAGAYQAAGDSITLSMYATPERNSVMTLIHEFGHRYHTRFLTGEKREEFIKLHNEGEVVSFTREERVRAADEYVELFRHHQQEDYPEPDTILSPKTQQYGELYPREMWKKLVSPWRKRFIDDKDNSVEDQLRKAIIYSVSSAPVEFPAVPDHLMQEKGIFASEYGRTSWEENFADSFMLFCMHKTLPAPLQAFMESL